MIKCLVLLCLISLLTHTQEPPSKTPCGMEIRINASEEIYNKEYQIIICDQCGRKAKVVIIACGEYCRFCDIHAPKDK